ncbi:MAG: GAF domain-containing protein, partial [Anaerolineae bacterium]
MQTTYELRQRSYLLKIARAMTSNLDLAPLLRLTLSAAAEMVQGEVGLIALSQPDDSYRVEAYYGIPHRLLPLFAPLLTDIRRSANLLERALTIPDLALKLHMVSTATGLPLRQVVALPLQVNQDLLGLIYIVRSGGAAFSANDRQVLQDFADQAAIAVRNARLYQAVNDERRRLDTIIQNSADGVMILTPERKIEVINRTLATLTGWTPAAAQGLPCYQVLALENVKGADLCQEMGTPLDLAGRGSVTAEGDLVRPGGSRITVGVTYTPLFDERAALQQIIVNVVDITRFREAEEMKSTFVSVITHELKTP